jgi:hypothetical protein
MTVYLSDVALGELRAAQRRLDEHPVGMDNRCRTCGTFGECPHRAGALAVFTRYGRMPSRLPGVTLPERLASPASLRVRPWLEWFGSAPAPAGQHAE